MMKKCIVVGAGDFVPVEIQKEDGDLCIAADGGLGYCERIGMPVDVIVGDFDSVECTQRQMLEEMAAKNPEKIVRLPKEKDDTDMMYAIRYGLAKGYQRFYLYGALGGRLDHSIGNIQILIYLRRQGAKGYIMEHNQWITIIQDETFSFPSTMCGRISIFSIEEVAEGVTISGLKYELSEAVVRNDFPIGISNEFIGEKASITVKHGMLLMMVTWE